MIFPDNILTTSADSKFKLQHNLSTLENKEEEDDIIYNPKNLPLGWDGKPIPYWLYKLHGLNIDYKCQICGNQTYRGPKAFQRHFSEWRHAHGMRCLGKFLIKNHFTPKFLIKFSSYKYFSAVYRHKYGALDLRVHYGKSVQVERFNEEKI